MNAMLNKKKVEKVEEKVETGKNKKNKAVMEESSSESEEDQNQKKGKAKLKREKRAAKK